MTEGQTDVIIELLFTIATTLAWQIEDLTVAKAAVESIQRQQNKWQQS